MQTELIPSLFKVNESVEVLVENVNDNPPNFAQNHFVLEVNEVSGGKLHLNTVLRYLYSTTFQNIVLVTLLHVFHYFTHRLSYSAVYKVIKISSTFTLKVQSVEI